jgi:hypothetical protein
MHGMFTVMVSKAPGTFWPGQETQESASCAGGHGGDLLPWFLEAMRAGGRLGSNWWGVEVAPARKDLQEF